MKQKQKALWVLVAVGWMAVQGVPPVWAKAMKETTPTFLEFHGKARDLPVVFEYPKSWKPEEEKGTIEKYQLVRLMGPRNPEDTYSSYISIVGSPVKKKGGKFDNLSEIVENYKAYQLAGAHLDDEKVTVLGGLGAVDLTVTSVIPPLFQKGLRALEIPVRTRTLFTQKGGMLYQITYSADLRLYDEHVKDFNRLLETLQFE